MSRQPATDAAWTAQTPVQPGPQPTNVISSLNRSGFQFTSRSTTGIAPRPPHPRSTTTPPQSTVAVCNRGCRDFAMSAASLRRRPTQHPIRETRSARRWPAASPPRGCPPRLRRRVCSPARSQFRNGATRSSARVCRRAAPRAGQPPERRGHRQLPPIARWRRSARMWPQRHSSRIRQTQTRLECEYGRRSSR